MKVYTNIGRINKNTTSFDQVVWVASYDCYIHIETSLFKLLVNVIKEYRNDRHLIG
jgi:hypothetical protein